MKIYHKKLTYMNMEQFNKYSISMKKMYTDLEEARKIGNFIWEQTIEIDLGIIDFIRKIQKENNIKILNYYCQASSNYSFIETLDGKKYVYRKYDRKLLIDSSWIVR